jgi:hypothetical protein
MTHLPDISLYILNKVIQDVDLEGVPVPGLIGNFYRRPEAGRTGTAGVYLLAGQELFISWGYADEAHCAWTAYRSGGGWTIPHQGCPRVRLGDGSLSLDTGVSLIRLPVGKAFHARPGAEAG